MKVNLRNYLIVYASFFMHQTKCDALEEYSPYTSLERLGCMIIRLARPISYTGRRELMMMMMIRLETFLLIIVQTIDLI